jgi:hypothetical protein
METPQGPDSSGGRGGKLGAGKPLIDEEAGSKNAAKVDLSIKINGLSCYGVCWDVAVVAKSLQLGARRKAERDQSVAQRWSQAGVSISFRCSAFGTGGGRFWTDFESAINPVGASLLANTVCQAPAILLIDRFREQARSHMGNFLQ